MTKELLQQADELKPCPFCGEEAFLKERHNEGYSKYGRFWWSCGCEKCDIIISDREEFHYTSDGRCVLKYPAKECIEKWNTRTPDIQALADEARGKVWQPIKDEIDEEIIVADEEIIGCIEYQKGKYGTPFACAYNDKSEQYESIRVTELRPHIPTHLTPLPQPPKEK